MYCKYSEINKCGVEDFTPVVVFDAKRFRRRMCYKFNWGVEDGRVIRSSKVGYASGINLGLVLPTEDFIIYFIGDNQQTPVFREISGRLFKNHI